MIGLKNLKSDNKGFIAAEFAISLPLVIFLLYSLANVTLKAVQISKNQIADYVLETEIHDVISRITADARAADSVQFNPENQQVIFIFHTNAESGTNYTGYGDIYDTRRYIGTTTNDGHSHIVVKRVSQNLTTPITGGNYFGDTAVTKFQFSTPHENFVPAGFVPSKKILHIKLAMKSMVTGKEIEINTSVFMPGCRTIKGL